jgi:phosphoglycerate kinase
LREFSPHKNVSKKLSGENMPKKTVTDLKDLRGKKVFVRVDFNVPMDGEEIRDDIRIRESLPTIKHLIAQGARVILASHLGRPKGKVVASMSLGAVAKRLGELIGTPVKMAPDCIGEETAKLADSLAEGDVLMLENVRFHPEEEKNDPEFARKLAAMADVSVPTHRPKASPGMYLQASPVSWWRRN